MPARWAITVWIAWLGLLGLGLGLMWWQVVDPNAILVLGLVGLILLSLMSLVISAGYRLLRGPGRRRALGWLLIGAAPGWLFLGHVLLAMRPGFDRHVPLGWAAKILIPFARPFFDLEARRFYPERTSGKWVTMVGAPVANAPAQVAAMDRHVDALLARLDQPRTWPIRWYRGSLFGLGGHALDNMALGAEVGQFTPESDGLTRLDRHEVAHTVIEGLRSPTNDPPRLLSEGWAQANAGKSAEELAREAWRSRQWGRSLTLRQLVAPDWYWYSGPAAYDQGAPLVNYLLQTYGPERFLQLYTTCGQTTFEADVQRILGVSLDELDTAYWAEINRLVNLVVPPARAWLETLSLAPGVDPVAWKSFLADYFIAAKRVAAPYDHVRQTATFRNGTDADRTQPWYFEERTESLRSGPFARYRRRTNQSEFAGLAHPDHSIWADRRFKPEVKPWTMTQLDPQTTADQTYRHALSVIESRASMTQWLTSHGATLLEFPELLLSYSIPEDLAVAGFQTTTEGGHRLVTLNLQGSPPTPGGKLSGFRFTFDADDGYLVLSILDQIHGQVGDTRFHYDQIDGRPVLRSLVTKFEINGQPRTLRMVVDDCRFGPIPESEFALEPFLASLGPGKLVRESAVEFSTSTILDWYWLAFVGGGISLAGGLTLLARLK